MGISGLFRRLGEILVRERLTTPDVVEQALVRARTTGERIVEAIDRTYDGVATPLQRIVEGMDDDRGGEGDEDVNQLRDMAFEAPVVRLVNLLIENAITSEASDIHIEPFEDTLRIRYRIDG